MMNGHQNIKEDLESHISYL